jgi:hypothetical protein
VSEQVIRTQADFADYSDSAIWREELAEALSIQPWIEVGATGAPSFQNSWANVGGTNDETLAFKKELDRFLFIKGEIDSGTIADGTVVFTLPEGYRPKKTIKVAGMFVQGSTENSYQLEIQVGGDVAIYGVSGASPELSVHCVVYLRNA